MYIIKYIEKMGARGERILNRQNLKVSNKEARRRGNNREAHKLLERSLVCSKNQKQERKNNYCYPRPAIGQNEEKQNILKLTNNNKIGNNNI